jgi:hypothetical protein
VREATTIVALTGESRVVPDMALNRPPEPGDVIGPGPGRWRPRLPARVVGVEEAAGGVETETSGLLIRP